MLFGRSQQETSTTSNVAAIACYSRPSEKEKWLKFRCGLYHFKFTFILYADFESILKPVDEHYRVKMNKLKTERKGKTPYTEKTNTHVAFGWCTHSTFAHKDVHDPLKRYRGEDCVEKFIEHSKNDLKRLYATFS